MRVVIALLLCAACSFRPGTLGSDAPGMPGEAGPDVPRDDAAAGVVFVGTNSAGASGTGIVRVAATGMSSATYVLGVATKPYQPVLSVGGLAANWTTIEDQCGARSQTGVALYVGRGANLSGDIEVHLQGITTNVIATVVIYTGSSSNGASASANAVDPMTCNLTAPTVDSASYAFPIASADGLVVAGVAIRGATNTPGADLTERDERKQGTGGDIAGLAMMDGPVMTVAGSLSGTTDFAAAAVELRP